MQQPRNFSMTGAIDLGARQAAAKRRDQGPAAPGASGGSAFVFDVTDASFNADVVARSQTAPVIVDLWAEWCGPCKQLGPVLERLADEAAGDWLLARVDVDANPQLSAALQVQSIPMVLAVIGGQLLPGFLGALPEAQVRQYIDQVLQVAAEMGMPPRASAGAAGAQAPAAAAGTRPAEAGVVPPEEAEILRNPRLRAARDAMEAGDLNGAANALSQVLDDLPDHPVAKAWLAQVELIRRVSSYDHAKVRRAAQEQPDDPEAQARAADLELADGQVEASFDRLLGLFRRTAGQDRDKARVHLLSLFEILPPRDPRVSRARAKLSSMLF